jgi:hypothetical protein
VYSVVPVISAMSCREMGKVDFDSRFHPAARLPDEPQHRARDPTLDAFGHELAIAALEIVEAFRDDVQRVQRQRDETRTGAASWRRSR